ncbi:MAG: hypothetical protein QOF76_5532, partial [Solirubrobacteraceae bacterium]|nr:hypothetical protein [Solirubrobacteraceae bacterium]
MERFGRLDALLDRGYRRFGWRLLAVYAGATWVGGIVLMIPVFLLFLRVGQPADSDVLRTFALAIAAGVIGTATGLWLTHRLLRPIATWFADGRDPADPAAAWAGVHRLPAQISVRNAAVGAIIGGPFWLVILRSLMPVEVAAVALMLLILGAGIAMVTAVGTYGLQLALRPLIRDAARTLDAPPAPQGGTSMRAKLLLAVPAIALFGALVAGLAGLDAGDDWGDCLRQELLIALGMLLLVGPATVLLAYSTLRPLDDLMRTTERLREGDLVTRVPELSGDEYGALAESFNRAITGLAEREQLARANEELLDAVRASRQRVIAASDAERRRVERNLHDGAQQRLVALALDLRMLGDMAAAGELDEVQVTAAEAGEAVQAALTELRELARGLHPSVLSTDGLAPAIAQVAERAPLPVEVRAPEERYPEDVESTAYFVASEALANVAKYAQASHATVSVERRNGHVIVQIADDGVGG